MQTIRKHLAGRLLASAAIVLSTVTAAYQSPAGAQTACPVSAADQAVDAEEQEALNLVNQFRVANGLNAVSLSTNATRAAAWFSRDMASKNYAPPDHVDSNRRTIGERIGWCGVTFGQSGFYGEVIYWGSPDGTAAFNWWRDSPPHRAIMLDRRFTHAGVARAFDASSTFDWYWTIDFTAGEVLAQPPPTATVVGAAFFIDGTSSRTGPSGARVSVFATGTEPGFSYKLVSGRSANGRPCATDVLPVNDTVRFANAQGVISQTAGTLNRPAGQWQVCFLAAGQVVTGAATYNVTG